jgi:spore germination protein KB
LELSFVTYKSTMEMTDWAYKIYPYYSLMFQVIIPFIIFVAIKIKAIKKNI